MWSVFRLATSLGADADRARRGRRGRGAVRRAGRRGRRGPRRLRRRGPARRRRRDGLVARRRRPSSSGGLPPAAAHGVRRAASSRSGRRWRCTGRRSSTRATSRRSWPTRSRAATSASTRSCGPTSGTSSRTTSAARCSPSTARWRATSPTCAPTRSPRFALGDYEWMLAFEADELHRIVDLMRRPARIACAAARARGGSVLHGTPQAGRRAGGGPAVTATPRSGEGHDVAPDGSGRPDCMDLHDGGRRPGAPPDTAAPHGAAQERDRLIALCLGSALLYVMVDIFVQGPLTSWTWRSTLARRTVGPRAAPLGVALRQVRAALGPAADPAGGRWGSRPPAPHVAAARTRLHVVPDPQRAFVVAS